MKIRARRSIPALGGGIAKGDDALRSPEGGRRMAARAGPCAGWAPPNKRMHPTRDTKAVIVLNRAGGRVMRGVRLLLRFEITAG